MVVSAVDPPSPREMRRSGIPPVLRQFWPVTVGLPQRPHDSLSFARGFCEGAMGFWSQVKDKI
jgi:hypothetical protein